MGKVTHDKHVTEQEQLGKVTHDEHVTEQEQLGKVTHDELTYLLTLLSPWGSAMYTFKVAFKYKTKLTIQLS